LASIGTDTGCSVRIPAALCGIVGLKPRFGDVPTEGVLPLSRRLDHVGPLTRNVADARLLYLVMAGRPARDEAVTPDLASLSAGLVDARFATRVDAAVRGAIDAALDRLRAAGLTTQPAPLGVLDDAAAAYLPICLADAAALHAATLETQASDYTPSVRARLEAGRYVAAEDYARATQGQVVLRQAVDRALGRADVLLLPTSPVTAPTFGTATIRFGDAEEPIRSALLRLCQPFNLTRHPAIRTRTTIIPAAVAITDICGAHVIPVQTGIPAVGIGVNDRAGRILNLAHANVGRAAINVTILGVGQKAPEAAISQPGPNRLVCLWLLQT